MTRSLIGRALRVGALSWRSLPVRPSPFQQQKCFSQSPSPQNSQVIFDKNVSSPELDTVLEEIQNTIILPSYLPARQQKRIHSRKTKDNLKSDPVFIEIDGIEHKFDHIGYGTLQPSKKLVRSAINLMKTKEDWANFVRLLSGMKNADRKMTESSLLSMTRQAGWHGQIHTVVDAIRQAKKTGFQLNTVELVTYVLYYVQIKAPESNWDKEVTQKALAGTEMILDLLEQEIHVPSSPPPGGFPLHKDPQVLGAALQITAAMAVKHNDDAARKKCISYAERLANAWPAGKGLLNLYPEETYKLGRGNLAYLRNSRTEYLSVACPIKYGLDLATQVVEPTLAARLQAISATLEPELKNVLEGQTFNAQRGLYTYKQYFEERPETETERPEVEA